MLSGIRGEVEDIGESSLRSGHWLSEISRSKDQFMPRQNLGVTNATRVKMM